MVVFQREHFVKQLEISKVIFDWIKIRQLNIQFIAISLRLTKSLISARGKMYSHPGCAATLVFRSTLAHYILHYNALRNITCYIIMHWAYIKSYIIMPKRISHYWSNWVSVREQLIHSIPRINSFPIKKYLMQGCHSPPQSPPHLLPGGYFGRRLEII